MRRLKNWVKNVLLLECGLIIIFMSMIYDLTNLGIIIIICMLIKLLFNYYILDKYTDVFNDEQNMKDKDSYIYVANPMQLWNMLVETWNEKETLKDRIEKAIEILYCSENMFCQRALEILKGDESNE